MRLHQNQRAKIVARQQAQKPTEERPRIEESKLGTRWRAVVGRMRSSLPLADFAGRARTHIAVSAGHYVLPRLFWFAAMHAVGAHAQQAGAGTRVKGRLETRIRHSSGEVDVSISILPYETKKRGVKQPREMRSSGAGGEQQMSRLMCKGWYH